MKIVSLLPSATEIVCQLGLREQLVGVTHECDYPSDVVGLPVVTRTMIPERASSREIDTLVREQLKTRSALYSLDADQLRELDPDLIVTQTLCNVCAVAESEVVSATDGMSRQPRVINLQPTCLEDVYRNIHQVAEAAQIPEQGDRLVSRLRERVDLVARRSESIGDRPTVLFLEWIDPPFSAGHWTPELIEMAGGQCVVGTAGEPSVTLDWQSIAAADPDVLVVACCGFDIRRTLEDLPILQSRPGWGSMRCVVQGRVHVIDGSAYFNRPGPRLVDSLEVLAHAIDPTVHPLPAGRTAALTPRL